MLILKGLGRRWMVAGPRWTHLAGPLDLLTGPLDLLTGRWTRCATWSPDA
jgi:hypothetical protein